MEFVERGEDGGDEEGNDEDSVNLQTTLTESAAKKRGENPVFSQVSTLAHDHLDRGYCCVRNMGSEPAEQRTDEPRGALRGKQVRGPDEDENHPGQDRQPEFYKSAHQKRNHNAGACANLAPQEL